MSGKEEFVPIDRELVAKAANFLLCSSSRELTKSMRYDHKQQNKYNTYLEFGINRSIFQITSCLTPGKRWKISSPGLLVKYCDLQHWGRSSYVSSWPLECLSRKYPQNLDTNTGRAPPEWSFVAKQNEITLCWDCCVMTWYSSSSLSPSLTIFLRRLSSALSSRASLWRFRMSWMIFSYKRLKILYKHSCVWAVLGRYLNLVMWSVVDIIRV